MEIKGFQGISLIDYPGKISTVIFTGGCNFRCPFCHNKDLVLSPEKVDTLEPNQTIGTLKERKNFIDGVVITGGEPTLSWDIISFAQAIKNIGLLIKLDTNGCRADVLKELIGRELIDYAALDIKTSFDKYEEAAGVKVEIKRIEESIGLILASKINYEFRTTVVPGIVEEEDIKKIGERVRGAKRYALQQFVNKNTLDESYSQRKPYEPKVLKDWGRILEDYAEEVLIRGIELSITEL